MVAASGFSKYARALDIEVSAIWSVAVLVLRKKSGQKLTFEVAGVSKVSACWRG